MEKIIRVLQVEDSDSDAALISRLIERAGYEVRTDRVEDAETMRAALIREPWDVIIADHRMAQFNAPAALAILRESNLDVPFIVVSGSIGEELAVSMMKSGAHDYVPKDKLARLVPAVEREIREAQSRFERRRAEQDLHESRERLTLAIRATQLGTFDFTPATGVMIWSELTKRHFGLPYESEVTYDTFLRGIHPSDRERVHTTVLKLLSPGSDGQYAIEYKTVGIADKVERYISSWGSVFFDLDGQPIRLVCVTLDITERKCLEDQLLQAQKLESVGRLAGGIAHDFNNLLTVIQGWAHMAEKQLAQQHPVCEWLQEIGKAATRATNLTQQLLTFSRRKPTELKDLLINDLVQDVDKMLRRLIGQDVELVLSLHPDAGSVRADPVQIEQVLMNLAVNAKDAMAGGGMLFISTAPLSVDGQSSHASAPPAGEYVKLSVTDTGSGMSPEILAHLFEPFFTTKGPDKGTGLGLSTVYGIVTQCGGQIFVQSEPGRGSTFDVLLPAVFERSEPLPSAAYKGSTSARETILLAEDEPGVRTFVREVLNQDGYTVLETANGKEALSQARSHTGPIHLVLTDAVMPEMGGFELTRALKDTLPHIPVLCMSGFSDDDWENGQSPEYHIQKPFGPSALLTRVRDILDATVGART